MIHSIAVVEKRQVFEQSAERREEQQDKMTTNQQNSTQKRRRKRRKATHLMRCLSFFVKRAAREQLVFVFALTLANQICDINSTPIQQQQHRTGLARRQAAAAPNELSSAGESTTQLISRVFYPLSLHSREPISCSPKGNLVVASSTRMACESESANAE